MKIPISIVAGLAVKLSSASIASFYIGPTFSGGEINKAYSYDMQGSEGIYAFGLCVSGEMKYAEASLQLESGRYNRNLANGIGIDVNGKYGIFQERVKLYLGYGFAYNGYADDKWSESSSDNIGEYSHDFTPYWTAKTELFRTVRIGFEELFDSGIFWKVRLGLTLYRF